MVKPNNVSLFNFDLPLVLHIRLFYFNTFPSNRLLCIFKISQLLTKKILYCQILFKGTIIFMIPLKFKAPDKVLSCVENLTLFSPILTLLSMD